MQVSFNKQAGLLLLEVLAGLIILASVITGIAMMINRSSEDTQAAIAAQHLRTVGDAAAAYIRNNYTVVQAETNDGANLALITIEKLRAAGNLPQNFGLTNAYQQQTCILVKKTPDPDPNRKGQLIALAVTEGGNQLDDVTANTVANLVGASGGNIRSNTTTIIGSRNSWQINATDFSGSTKKCDGTEGTVSLASGRPMMALWLANGGINPDVIYRTAIPGRPDLNKMKTPLGLPSVTEGQPCKDTAGNPLDPGTIARNDSGDLLTCKDGKWIRASASGNSVLRKSNKTSYKPEGDKFKYYFANCDTEKGEKLIMGSCSAYCHQFVPIGGSPYIETIDSKPVAVGWKCVQAPYCNYEAAKVACTRTSDAPEFHLDGGGKDTPGILIANDENDIKECNGTNQGPEPCSICPAGIEDCTYCPYGSFNGTTCDIKCEYKKGLVRDDCKICSGSRCALCGEDEAKSSCESKLANHLF